MLSIFRLPERERERDCDNSVIDSNLCGFLSVFQVHLQLQMHLNHLYSKRKALKSLARMLKAVFLFFLENLKDIFNLLSILIS